MISGFGWAALALLFGSFAPVFRGSPLSAQAAGQPVRFADRAPVRDRRRADGVGTSVLLAFFGPLFWLLWPRLHKLDPLWTEGHTAALGLIGIFIVGVGALMTFATLGLVRPFSRVRSGQNGLPGPRGPCGFGHGPTVIGQFLLLGGAALAIPSIPTLLAPPLFLWSAATPGWSGTTALRAPRWRGLDRGATA